MSNRNSLRNRKNIAIRDLIEVDKFLLSDEKGIVINFLKKAETLGFELGITPLNAFIRKNKHKLFPKGTSEAKIIKVEKTLQSYARLFQITPDIDSMKILLEADFTSVHDITKITKEEFIETFGNCFSSPENAELVYDRSQYLCDLSITVNKYIRDTESKLKKLFEFTEDNVVILIQSGADNIFINMFGKQGLPYYGKYRGVIEDDNDPSGLGRVKLIVPSIFGDKASPWALPCVPYTDSDVDISKIPPVGTHVWVEFEGGDLDFPIWSGCFFQSD